MGLAGGTTRVSATGSMSRDPAPARRGVMLLVSSPSGAGKTSLSRRLVADHPELALSTSCTTRAPRPGEQDGREYHFLSAAAFESLISQDAFLEWADVHDHCYGSPRAPVEAALEAGQDVLFDVDWQGARSIAERAPSDVVRVFILPPSMPDLRRRLYARAQDSDEVIRRRLARAAGEIAHWSDCDYVIINDDFDKAYAELSHIYRAGRLRRERQPWLATFVAGVLNDQA